MSDEPLDLSNELLKSEELDVEGHLKDGADEQEDKSADEVEAHLLSHPDIVDAAIVAMSDELMGERSCAYVVTRGARLAAAQVAAFLTERGLAAYKLPDRIEQLDVLPSTSVGKVDKAKLRALIAAMLQSAPDGADAAARVA